MAMREPAYQAFTQKLIPTMAQESILGVRIPAIRALARELSGSPAATSFIQRLPHLYHEENMLHAFLIELERDFDRLMSLTEEFLPYIDNWAACDSFSPPLFKRYPKEMLPYIRRWMADKHPYTQRFGMKILMSNYLDEHFRQEMLTWVSSLWSEEYYVRMMQAWYFATALTKQYEAALPCIREKHLEIWTHNKAIQKAIESRLISLERKQQLREMKRK
ncbi:MAG: DNA alkylation repair protein [Clostridiales bacterium]|nr:DNA alkylation repair protein [Clostridiales bacterium]